MKDFVGHELKQGDPVVYLHHSRTSSSLRNGIIAGFTPRNVRIARNANSEYSILKDPMKVVKKT